MPEEVRFGQQNVSAASDPRRSIAQKFDPIEASQITAIEVHVRTAAFDGGGGRNKRVVVLNGARSAIIAQSSWTTTAFTEGAGAFWNRLQLDSPIEIDAGEDCWLGVEFELAVSGDDLAQYASANPPDAFSSIPSSGAFGTTTPSNPRTIAVPAGNSADLTDTIDGTNVIDLTLGSNGDWAIRALGFPVTREGWGMLI